MRKELNIFQHSQLIDPVSDYYIKIATHIICRVILKKYHFQLSLINKANKLLICTIFKNFCEKKKY